LPREFGGNPGHAVWRACTYTMCGIAALLRLAASGGGGADVDALVAALTRVLHRRGPDACGQATFAGPASGGTLLAHVLHLRGDTMALQPCRSDDGDLLCWNGEVFGGLDVPAGRRCVAA
jgi:asparagine synthetase B (glutamine-hydrolysing)